MTGEHLLEQMEGLDTELILESYMDPVSISRKRIAPRKLITFMLAATFIFAFAITAMAAVEQEWDVAILNFMGISGSDTTQLSDGTVSIGASDTQAGVTLTATSSIGSRNSAYFRIDTDYEVPKDYDLTSGHIVPEIGWTVWNESKEKPSLGGGSYSCDVDDQGKLYLIVQIMGMEDINKSHVELEIKDFYYYRDYILEKEPINMEDKILLLEGTWNLKWKYSYTTKTVKKHMNKVVQMEGNKTRITKIEVTPLELVVNGKTKFDSKEGRNNFTSLKIDSITLTDGTVITIEANGGGCGTSRSLLWMVRGVYDVEGYVTVESIGRPLDPKEVKSVTIGGVEISL